MSIKIKVDYIHGETNEFLNEIAFDYEQISMEELMSEIRKGYLEAYNLQPYRRKNGRFVWQ